ncbi:MAG: hypothetical protein HC836_33015 [Richelia sp. RM2_1_2]|nr:hypothetical protein [Richelia sp. RM2_1_2]
MSIILNDNLQINAGKPVEVKYLNGAVPYSSTAQVISLIPLALRFIGMTFNINNVEYWFKDGINDIDLVEKTSGGNSNATGERIEKTYTQSGHTFSIGDVIGHTPTGFTLVVSTFLETVEPIGVINEISGDSFTVCFHGYFNFSGSTINDVATGLPLTADTVYYLDTNEAGRLTSTAPTALNSIDKPMLVTLTATDCIVVNYRGAQIVTTGTTTGLTVSWNNVIGKPILLTGGTTIVNIGSGTGVYAGISAATHTMRSIAAGPGMFVTQSGDTIVLSASTATGGQIGVPDDGTYLDGLFPFTSGTTVANAIDPINQVLKALAPAEAPSLTNINSSGTFFNGKLSFGSTLGISGYVNVSTAAGNSAVDINGNYTASGTRLGIINTLVGGTLNSNVVGNIGGPGIPYENAAFGKANLGFLRVSLNGFTLADLSLSGTTGVTSNAYLSLSAIKIVKFNNGTPFDAFVYRTGTYSIPAALMNNGFNYLRILHNRGATTGVTNYVEWVYDAALSASTLTVSGTSLSPSMAGTKNISGVKYHTSGTATYVATYSNVYKNVFSNSSTAISFPTRINLGAMTLMNVTGAGINDRLTSSLQTLPDLDTSALNPENQIVNISASLPINSTKVLGNVGSTGQLSTNSSVLHPIPSESLTTSATNATGFLMYNVTETSTVKTENFNGETYRLEGGTTDYTVETYANIDGGTFAWDGAENLITGNTAHSNGLLVFDGALVYPNAAYLTTTYGITTGNFSAVTNAAAGNPNYTSASGLRAYYRKFKSTNVSTLATLTFTFTNTGVLANFLTDGGTGGTPTGDNIKVEFLIKRANGSTHGWANPFASSGNPEGIAVTSASHSLGVTTVSCTLSTTPRVANTDIVIVRIFAANSWSRIITNITISNI